MQRKGKETEEVVILPGVDTSKLIAQYNRSLDGRMLNREGRSTKALLALLPRANIWDVEGRVRGIDLGNSRFQFDFDLEEDLEKILNKWPCHFNKWSFALERWRPHVGDVFPNTMTFWVRTMGIPNLFWLNEIFFEFGKSFGDEPLIFEKKAQLPSGEIVKVSLKYEKLYRWCFTCGHISHDEDSCPMLSEEQKREKRLARATSREPDSNNREDKPQIRSKGKVIAQPLYRGESRERKQTWSKGDQSILLRLGERAPTIIPVLGSISVIGKPQTGREGTKRLMQQAEGEKL